MTIPLERVIEIWKTIPFAPDYSVSNLGRIKRVAPRLRFSLNQDTILRSNRCSKKLSYRVVSLKIDGKWKTATVHKCVTRAFLGEPEKGIDVNHKDGDKENNRLDNLEYVTAKQNTAHAVSMGLMKPVSKLKENDVLLIKSLLSRGFRSADVARMYSVSKTCIYLINKGKNWKHLKSRIVAEAKENG